MEVASLVSLGKSVMVRDSSSIVTETTEIALGSLLLLDCNSDDFYLVICKADFDLKLVWHDKFICLNGIVVILLLFGNLIAILVHHLLLHLLLLEFLLNKKIRRY